MIPKKYAQIVFSLILSGLMSLLVSGITTVRTAGLHDQTLGLWLSAWLPAWMVAFPSVMVVAPLTQKLVAMLVRKD